MVNRAVRSLLAEPRPQQPPPRVWRDWLLVAALGATLALEVVVRDLTLGVAPVGLVLLLAASLVYRRAAPLATVAIVFGALAAASVAALLGADLAVPYSLAWVLVLPYSLVRWGSGRDVAVGLLLMLGSAMLDMTVEFTGALDAGLGIMILLLPAALGASVRYRTGTRLQELEQVKLMERQQLARELHDTVAHHVSAIAVQAQAGRAVAPTNPAYAVEVLQVIEQTASRTLDEMRAVVELLRTGEDADLGPRRGIEDLPRLTEVRGWPDVDLHMTGDLDDLGPTLDSTLYRLAQESITNAARHARRARRIDVRVVGETDQVCLTVSDDGEPRATEPLHHGHGITGMRERAALLGGTLDAGPAPGGGWRVHAVLPRTSTP